jgi:hypothetical protein
MDAGKCFTGAIVSRNNLLTKRRKVGAWQGRSQSDGNLLGIKTRDQVRSGSFNHLGSEPLLIAQHRCRRRLQIPDYADPGKRPAERNRLRQAPTNENLVEHYFDTRDDYYASPRPS